MIGSMIGNKTVTSCTLLQQRTNMIKKEWITAGTQSLKLMFENIGTCHISKSNSDKEENNPPPAFYFKINKYQYEHEKIKWNPDNRIAQERHDGIEQRIWPFTVYDNKQVMIPLYYLLPESV